MKVTLSHQKTKFTALVSFTVNMKDEGLKELWRDFVIVDG